jgi:hypothetical protein
MQGLQSCNSRGWQGAAGPTHGARVQNEAAAAAALACCKAHADARAHADRPAVGALLHRQIHACSPAPPCRRKTTRARCCGTSALGLALGAQQGGCAARAVSRSSSALTWARNCFVMGRTSSEGARQPPSPALQRRWACCLPPSWRQEGDVARWPQPCCRVRQQRRETGKTPTAQELEERTRHNARCSLAALLALKESNWQHRRQVRFRWPPFR